jgi:hypothetical protein
VDCQPVQAALPLTAVVYTNLENISLFVLVSIAAWLHGCMVAWLHGCMVAGLITNKTFSE